MNSIGGFPTHTPTHNHLTDMHKAAKTAFLTTGCKTCCSSFFVFYSVVFNTASA